MDEFEQSGSGWKYKSTSHLVVCINKFSPLNVGEGVGGRGTYIDLPTWLIRQIGHQHINEIIVNVKNKDSRCFVWSILAHLFPVEDNPADVSSYPDNFHDFFNLSGIELPMKISDISKFERQNHNISINLFTLDDKTKSVVGPAYHTKQKKENHINLLFLKGKTNSNGHYCLIKNLANLMKKFVTKNHSNSFFVCDLCLNHFVSEVKFKKHTKDCSLFDPVKITLPEENKRILKFCQYKGLLMRPFVIYADFECLTKPVKTCEPDPLKSFHYIYQKHEPYSCAYYMVCSFDSNFNKFNLYRGDNSPTWFINEMENICHSIDNILKDQIKKTMSPLSDNQKETFEITQKCPICDKEFTENNPKVHHHDHYSGEYISAMCNNCNLQIKTDCAVSIFFHNLNYDSHLFIRELSRKAKSINIIPLTHENYISFSVFFGKIKLIFLDSFRFLPTSLDELVNSLGKSNNEDYNTFGDIRPFFENDTQFQLAIRKGIFPYDYVNSKHRLNDKCLPAKKCFFSKIKNTDITQEEYEHAQKVWSEFRVQTLGEYSDIYLKIDVLLLSIVFENFRKLTFSYFGLDPASFYTAPGLSFAASLKTTKIHLKLLDDVDMNLFIEKGIRGGIVQSIHRYSKCNNVYYPPTYDATLPKIYLSYWDVNNLYGFAQCLSIPYDDFRWFSEGEVLCLENEMKINRNQFKQIYGQNCPKSIILEVDLSYPDEIHEEHSDFAFCAEHLETSKNQKKLVCTLNDKEEYIIHFENLIQCLEHGLILTKIHRVIEFSHSPWLKTYIDFNTEKRKSSKSKFEETFWKNNINAHYGKTIERDRKKRDVKLVSSWKSARKYISRPEFKSVTIFDENLVAIELKKTNLILNKPIYIGFTVLELSKKFMYDFYYDYVKTRFSENFHVKICYMDTDSFVIKFTSRQVNSETTVYDIIRTDCYSRFDTSNYVSNNNYVIPSVNKKIPGMMKDELGGGIMTEFICLRSKMYTYKKDGKEVRPKMKGIAKSSSKTITFGDFYDSLFQGKQNMVRFNSIQNKLHHNYSVTINKIGLNSKDDKRHIAEDNISTIALGHYSLRKKKSQI